MIEIRDTIASDISQLSEINDKFPSGPFPDLESPLYCMQKTAIVDGKIVGGVFLHLTAELGLILDKDINKITRTKVIFCAAKNWEERLKHFGLDHMHLFVTPEDEIKYAEFLMRKFGFSKTKGIALERWV